MVYNKWAERITNKLILGNTNKMLDINRLRIENIAKRTKKKTKILTCIVHFPKFAETIWLSDTRTTASVSRHAAQATRIPQYNFECVLALCWHKFVDMARDRVHRHMARPNCVRRLVYGVYIGWAIQCAVPCQQTPHNYQVNKLAAHTNRAKPSRKINKNGIL